MHCYKTLDNINDVIYQVGIYIRLSKEDEKKDIYGKTLVIKSESVKNQKDLLTNYVRECNYNLVDIYIDDGYTGTNFERPDFQRMIEDILKGKINMVITKDLSRLGRDYIKTGEYVEKWFPEHNVRYVALTDNIDTALDSSNNEIAPFKSLLNDMYAKDLSKKIRTALYTKQRAGKWVGGCPPFGYKINPEDKNHLVIDEEESVIVKRMFKLFLNGNSIQEIVNKFNAEKVSTFSITRQRNFERKNGYNIYGTWSCTTIKRMLKNRLYTGDLIQNRRSRINYKFRKVVVNKEEDWIIVENTHEAIISKKDFKKIQQLLPNQKRRNDKKEYRLLDGILYCYECKHHIGIRARNKYGYSYMSCNYYRKFPKSKFCTAHGFSYDILEKNLFNKLKEIFLILNTKRIKTIVLIKSNKYHNNINIKVIIKKLVCEIDNLKSHLDKMYIDKLNKKIDEVMFDRVYSKTIEDIKEKEKQLSETQECLKNMGNSENNDDELYKLIKEFLQLKCPTRELIIKLIKRIEIHDDKTVDVYFKFNTLEIINNTYNKISDVL